MPVLITKHFFKYQLMYIYLTPNIPFVCLTHIITPVLYFNIRIYLLVIVYPS